MVVGQALPEESRIAGWKSEAVTVRDCGGGRRIGGAAFSGGRLLLDLLIRRRNEFGGKPRIGRSLSGGFAVGDLSHTGQFSSSGLRSFI
jgi:hypothetical protein